MTIDIKNLSQDEFKALQRQLAAEQKNRGPSGKPRLSVDVEGLKNVTDAIEELAVRHETHPVEVLDACVRFWKLQYYITSSKKNGLVAGNARVAS